MSIQIGKPAPSFSGDAYVRSGSGPVPLSLAGYRGRWVVLVFYPRDFTFVCPTELQALAALDGAFAQESAAVVAASTDSYHAHKAWYEGDPRLAAVEYPVVADTAHRLASAFGVLLDDGTALRGTFIIDPEGIVRHVLVNDLDVGRNHEDTLRTLRALRTGQLCPAGWRPGQRTLGGLPEAA
jgi:peroxiredoxin (alkyl hydroperoxide reductase subunit C)